MFSLKESTKEWIDLGISALILAIVINMAVVITVALLNGNWIVWIDFNSIGEGPSELFLIYLFIALQVRNIFRQWKDIREERRRIKEDQG